MRWSWGVWATFTLSGRVRCPGLHQAWWRELPLHRWWGECFCWGAALSAGRGQALCHQDPARPGTQTLRGSLWFQHHWNRDSRRLCPHWPSAGPHLQHLQMDSGLNRNQKLFKPSEIWFYITCHCPSQQQQAEAPWSSQANCLPGSFYPAAHPGQSRPHSAP